MKTLSTSLLLLLLVLGFAPQLPGQAQAIYDSAERVAISSHREQALPVEATYFKVPLFLDYNGFRINNQSALTLLQTHPIRTIRLYYSDYPPGQDLSLLNLGRIDALLRQVPQAAADTVVWQIVKQTDCTNRREAQKRFHGFEVLLAIPDDIKLSTIQVDSSFQDFVVDRVLRRNDWREMLIVTDVTGSMAPYTSQLFLWLQLNTLDDRVKQFVFFNDGDYTRDADKVIGQTGGIYHTKSKAYREVELTALQSMFNGGGGDSPENDVEALLRGLHLCPDCQENILIADNFSKVRDLELLHEINQPIRIIICGSETGVNVEYLNLARDTGGSIHLMEEDLFELIQLNEGKTLEINGFHYQIVDNRFVRIKGL